MREVASNVWVIEEPHSMFGVQMGARMTLVRLSSGELWIYAPFETSRDEIEAIEKLGNVRHLVVPSPFHATEAASFAARFPEATLWTIPEAHSHLRGYPSETLYALPEAWKADFDAIRFDAAIKLCEWDFCHRASGTLIITDLCLNLPRPRNLPGYIAKLLLNVGGRFGPSRFEKLLILSNVLHRDAARWQIKQILGWEFDRVIVTHGNIVERGGKKAFERAFKWLLKLPPVFDPKAKGDHMPGVGA